MTRRAAFAVLALAAALTGCGKVGGPDIPQGSTYPKVYPADAAHGALQPQQLPYEVGQKPAFTPSGAWIDPDQLRPRVDPYADTVKSAQSPLSGAATPTMSGESGAAAGSTYASPVQPATQP